MRTSSSAYRNGGRSSRKTYETSQGVTNIEDSVYEYDRYPQQRVAPQGVDTRLPKELKSTKR